MSRISVIIPHLNEQDALIRCLNALESQRTTAPTFEIIVADNGSTHTPTEICAAFSGTRLVIETVPGPGPARNAGAAIAGGEILAFIDCDCIAEPGWLANIAEYFDANPQISFLGGAIGIAPKIAGRLTAIEAYESVFSYRAKMFVERDKYAATGNMAVRADVFRTVGPFDGIASYEDVLWGQRATSLGFAIAYLPQAKVQTPACNNFSELQRRLDRNVAHMFNQRRGKRRSLEWLMLAVANALSPPLEIGRIVASPELPNAQARYLAFLCLTRARLYRAYRMIQLLNADWTDGAFKRWNRDR